MSLETFVTGLNLVCGYLGAPVLVALFYWFRFHTLKGTRSYTTLLLYCVGIAVFVLPFLLMYFAIVYAVREAVPLEDGISASSAICLVILAWLVPGPPQWWRDFCQRMARIPFFAYSLRNMLCNSAWELPAADWPDISRKLARIGYPIEDLRALQSAPIQSRFLKIATIMFHLEQWKLQGNRFLDRNSEHYSDLLAVYDLLSFKAIRALKNTAAIYGAIMEDSKVEPDDWRALDSFSAQNDSSNRLQSAAKNAAGGMLEDLRKDMDFLLEHLFLLVARCALASAWSAAGRKRRLEEIGFTVTPPTYAILWMAMAAVVLSVATVLVWFAAIRNPSDLISGVAAVGVTRSFVISPLIIIVSVSIIYHLKRNYAFANEGVFGGLPYKFIFSIGIVTALLLFPVQAGFDYYQFPDDYVVVLMHELPVLLYMWATTTVIALLVQDSMWRSLDSRWARRAMDGIVFGAVWVFAIGLLFAINQVFPIPVMEKLAKASLANIVILIFGFSFVAGFVLAFVLIAPLRQATSFRIAREEMTLGPALAHA
ncbi:hypothetical protein QA641_35335 [Bradyrhizobium sp. CB1650]|uniref:hypothetical protein n=1 Tax=Bradyrhizobium sp. CB1650 TaxID=3039153 RepID=UPI002434E645|nr:hypothetical protein [Bradyrhizobium sp. CB1650]WGD50818.1 hypothetical protein QA641_35335 [Bradyrhizobium sp. CB1650]